MPYSLAQYQVRFFGPVSKNAKLPGDRPCRPERQAKGPVRTRGPAGRGCRGRSAIYKDEEAGEGPFGRPVLAEEAVRRGHKVHEKQVHKAGVQESGDRAGEECSSKDERHAP